MLKRGIFDVSDVLVRIEGMISHTYDDDKYFGLYHKFSRKPIANSTNLFYKIVHDGNVNYLEVNMRTEPMDHEAYVAICDSKQKPLVTRDMIKNNMISFKPFHPIMPVEILNNLVDVAMVKYNPNSELLFTNPLIDAESESYVALSSPGVIEEDILESMLAIVDESLVYEVLEQYTLIMDMYILPLIKSRPSSLWELKSVGTNIELLEVGELKALRFDEAINRSKILKEVIDDEAKTHVDELYNN